MTFSFVLIGIILLVGLFVYIQRRKIISLKKEVGTLEHTVHSVQELNKDTNKKLQKISKIEREVNEKIKSLDSVDADTVNNELNSMFNNKG